MLDRMYKGKLQPGDLDAFDEETIERMKAEVVEKREFMAWRNNVNELVNL